MRQYLDLMERVLRDGRGKARPYRHRHAARFSAIRCASIWPRAFRWSPPRSCIVKSIIYELLWFLRGETNVRWLQEHGVTIWDEWADASGELGPVYGHQWRSWPDAMAGTIDQIANLIARHQAQSGFAPADRHRLESGRYRQRWRCRPAIACSSSMSRTANCRCQLYQRSADIFLGVPFNIASYALLTMMVAQVTGLKPGEFVHTFGDAHLYLNHLEQAREQLARKPYPLPTHETESRR